MSKLLARELGGEGYLRSLIPIVTVVCGRMGWGWHAIKSIEGMIESRSGHLPAIPMEVRGLALYSLISVLVLVQIIDGLDMLSLAFVGPAISQELSLARSGLGACIGIAFLGMAVGAMFFGWIAGWIGKKRTLVMLVVLMTPAALATSQVGGLFALFTLRLAMGFVLGGIFPVAAAMLLERAEAGIKTTAVSLISFGSSCGAIACGFVASLIVPTFGWRSMFVVTGLLPLVLLPAVLWVIPKDTVWVAVRGEDDGVASTDMLERPQSTIWGQLRAATLLLWSASFFCAVPAFFVIGWLPTLAKTAGATPAGSAVVASIFTTVGAIGGVIAARLVDRFGLRIVPLLTGAAAIAAAALGGAIGTELLSVASAVAGLLVVGLLTLTGAISGQVYPTAIRAFGVGCGIAVMRLGATAGPWVGGVALDAGYSITLIFASAAGLVLIGGTSLRYLRRAAEMQVAGHDI